MRNLGQRRMGYPVVSAGGFRAGQPGESESIASSERKPQCATCGKHHWGQC